LPKQRDTYFERVTTDIHLHPWQIVLASRNSFMPGSRQKLQSFPKVRFAHPANKQLLVDVAAAEFLH
jgi:hypothetical protein